MNTLKTVFLMTLMTVLFLLVGSLIGGERGMLLALGVSLLMNLFSYWFSDKIVLMMYRAREVTQAEAPKLYAIVTRVASAAQISMPRVYIIPGDRPYVYC